MAKSEESRQRHFAGFGGMQIPLGRTHNIFICWSGARSLHVALFLREWLPTVLQSAKPWISEADIDKGTVGLDEIKKALSGTRVGIVCLTPENWQSQWIAYESGALAKEIGEKTRLCTYLLAGLEPQHIKGPLGMFQHTRATVEETRKLLHTINNAISDDPVPETKLNNIFGKMWPDLKQQLDTLPSLEAIALAPRSSEDMLAEVLELSRAAANSRKQSEWFDQYAPDFREALPTILELFQTAKTQLMNPPPPPAPPATLPREPKAAFCVKVAGDTQVKRIEGTMAVENAVGSLIILVGSEMVAKFDSGVEQWWKEPLSLGNQTK